MATTKVLPISTEYSIYWAVITDTVVDTYMNCDDEPREYRRNANQWFYDKDKAITEYRRLEKHSDHQDIRLKEIDLANDIVSDITDTISNPRLRVAGQLEKLVKMFYNAHCNGRITEKGITLSVSIADESKLAFPIVLDYLIKKYGTLFSKYPVRVLANSKLVKEIK